MYCPTESTGMKRIGRGVIACFMGDFEDSKLFSNKRKHFRHKRHSFKVPVAVETPKDFVLASNLNPIPNP